MTERENFFCEFIAQGYTVIEACEKSGYKKLGIGKQLMKKEEIKTQIEKLVNEKLEESIAPDKEILSFLTNAMRGEGDEEIDIRTRMRAAELLSKRGKLFEKDIEKEEKQILIVDDIS